MKNLLSQYHTIMLPKSDQRPYLAFPPLLRKVGAALLVCSFIAPHLLAFCGYPPRCTTFLLLLCQGTGLALVTRNSRLWLAVTLILLLPAWYWPVTLRLIDLCSLYSLAIAAPCLVFIRSLLPQHEPLITSFARQVHGTLRPDITRYTYCLTWFWSLFFLTALIAPVLLWAYGPPNAWRWPLNGGTLALAAIFMVLEYGLRRILIRNFNHASLHTSIDIFLKQS